MVREGNGRGSLPAEEGFMTRRATIAALIPLLLLAMGCANRCVLPGCEECDPCDPNATCATGCGSTVGDPCAPCAGGFEVTSDGTDTRMSSDWVGDLRSSDRVTRDRAVDALAHRGPGIIRDVGPLLDDPDPAVRFSALQVFVRLREHSYSAVWYVKNRLSDSDPAIRADAAYVIGLAGECAAEAVPQLTGALRDTSPYVRYRAAVAFQKMNAKGEPALDALRHAARCDRDARVREAARCAVDRIERATYHCSDGGFWFE
jgi:hypothetical protein